MRRLILALIAISMITNTAAFDAAVDIRDSATMNASNVTDAYMVENEAYPNGSPFNATITTTLFYGNNSSIQQSRRVTNINKYAYADTSNFSVTTNMSRVCVGIDALNRTDSHKDNNEDCKEFIEENRSGQQSPNTTSTSTQGQQNTSKVNLTRDESAVSEPETTERDRGEPTELGTSTSQQSSQHLCSLLSDVPPLVQSGESIEFTVNADNGAVTYWAENQRGQRVKSKVTTTNTGTKQYTPEEEDFVVFKASDDACQETDVLSTGVVKDEMESYINVEEVTAERPTLQVTLSHHSPTERSVSVVTQDQQLATVTLPAGTTSLTASFPTNELESGIATLHVEADESSDSYRYRLEDKRLKARYPDLIESVYHRKEYFGPTTLYVSLKERVNGELVVSHRTNVQRKDINGSNVEITVLPSTPEERLGITINNRLGETVDETQYKLDLEKRDNSTQRATRSNPSPDERVEPKGEKKEVNASKPTIGTANTSNNNGVQAFSPASKQGSTPYVSAAGLLATLGYFAYWLRGRFDI